MILRKVIDNGKEIYVPISMDEALNCNKNDLIFSDDDAREEFEDFEDELEDELNEEEEYDEDDDDDSFSIRLGGGKSFHINTRSLSRLGRDAGKVVSQLSGLGRFFKEKKENSRLEELLPFLSQKELSELVPDIINNPENFSKLDLEELFPFLSQEECDKLFVAALESNIQGLDIEELVPFVSPAALKAFVDAYVEGNYQETDIEELYPFLDSESIGKLFRFFMK